MAHTVFLPRLNNLDANLPRTIYYGNGTRPNSTVVSNVEFATLPTGNSLYLTLQNAKDIVTTVDIALAIASLTIDTTSPPAVTTLKAWRIAKGEASAVESPANGYPNPNGETLFIPVTAQIPAAGVMLAALENELSTFARTTAPSSTPSTTMSASEQPSSGSATTTASASLNASTLPTEASSGTAAPLALLSTNGGSISTGGAVGGIVGALAGGLVLGVLLAYLCLRRKRKPGRNSVSSTEHELKPMAILGGNSTRSRLSLAPAALVGWKKHIPQEQSEKDLANSLSSINDHIEMYVAEFYGSRRANVTAGQIASLGTVADVETMKYAKAAQRQEPILERVIAAFLVSRISFKSENTDSLLPADLSTIPKRLGLNLESRDIGPRAYTERSGFLAAVAEWRVLTAFLTTDVDPKAQKKLEDKVDKVVKLLTAGLSSFENEQQDDPSNREQALHKIVVNMSAAGQALFRQPSTFAFDWTDRSRSDEPSMTTFPALVKVMEENGHKFDKPKTVLSARAKPY